MVGLGSPQVKVLPASGGMACIAEKCKEELVACVASPTCGRGLACAGSQAASPTGQVRCMDLYENELMRRFADCAMTENECLAPLPADATELKSFERAVAAVRRSPPKVPPELLRGTWKVALGLNPAFDCFDCQVHEFREDGSAVFRYRVRREDGSCWASPIGSD
ncbi:hypothetical protein CTAYLR_007755 [Chrysophaeum taylorii]|uniref:VDE lipocalin domain-containing protein n=1 Tax=Chrysophaeum taylorii TaxID=2483200 RepID=A0AAD7XKA7_9STRA|nr:hypothetical protein CTAYLR_007755 [Chrysophaeum taylorii]